MSGLLRGGLNGLNDWNVLNASKSYRIRMFIRPHMQGFFYLRAENLFAVLAVGDHGVVVQGHFAAAQRRLVNLRSFLDLVAEDDSIRAAEKLQDREQFAIRVSVALDGVVDA